MTPEQLTALDALISAVDAGTAITADFDDYFGVSPRGVNSIGAYHGSLDAAKALHNDLLPGWIARPQIGGAAAGVTIWHCVVEDWEGGIELWADNMPCPARAWLLAILRVIRTEATQ